MRRTIVAGGILAALVAGVLAIGLASAQTQSPEPSVTDEPQRLGARFKEELAKQLGISVDQLNTALDNTQFALIDEAVADGKLTESEAQRLRERVEDGHNLFPMRGARPFIRHHAKVGLAEAAAEVLGLSVEDVRTAIAGGQTLAEIASANGMDTEDFKSALLENVKGSLDEKVSAGDITRDQADRLYERLSENIDDIVNHEPWQPGEGRPFPRFQRGPRFWQDGPPPFGDDDAEEDHSPTIF
jgi:polyhydroxyalkanoate synthesis regulator phasin